MSEPSASPAPAATAEKPATEAPAEPPFNTDVLQSCTARFTHKAWYLYYNNRDDMTFIRQQPLRFTLTARTPQGAEELHTLLVEEGVREISRAGDTLSLTATLETLQKVIRLPQTLLVDAVKL